MTRWKHPGRWRWGVALTLALLSATPATAQSSPFAWEMKADIPDGIEGAAAGVIGNTLYVSHGDHRTTGDSAGLFVYNIASDTWALGPSATFPRSELVGAVEGGKLFAIGGRFSGVLQTVEIFDPVSNSWSQGMDMPTARAGLGAATVAGLIHVIGGRDDTAPGTGTAMNTHEVYDPDTDSWSTAAALPTAVMDNYATVALGSKIYVLGGGTGGISVVDLVQIYDTTTNSWSLGAPMPTARSNAVAGVICGRIVVAGGLDDTFTNITTTEIYDPVANEWTTGPDKPRAASEMGSGAAYNQFTLFAVGSGSFGLTEPFNDALTCPLARAPAVSWHGLVLCGVGLLLIGMLSLKPTRQRLRG